MIVHVFELIRYRVELSDDTTDPEDTAVDAIVNSADRDKDYFESVEERYAKVVEKIG